MMLRKIVFHREHNIKNSRFIHDEVYKNLKNHVMKIFYEYDNLIEQFKNKNIVKYCFEYDLINSCFKDCFYRWLPFEEYRKNIVDFILTLNFKKNYYVCKMFILNGKNFNIDITSLILDAGEINTDMFIFLTNLNTNISFRYCVLLIIKKLKLKMIKHIIEKFKYNKEETYAILGRIINKKIKNYLLNYLLK